MAMAASESEGSEEEEADNVMWNEGDDYDSSNQSEIAYMAKAVL